MKKTILVLIFLNLVISSSKAQADNAELAKKLANPVASLISLPLQNNTDIGIGAFNGTRNTMNVQPVVPIGITPKWNLIGRVVLPIVTQYNIVSQGSTQSGLSDAVVSAFLSPAESKNGLTWGVGPAFLLPTGTNDFLTTEKFGMGPTAVALYQTKGWTIGALVNQIWSIGGPEDRTDISQMFLQPFVTYNWTSGAGLGVNLEWTQTWRYEGTTTMWLNPVISGVTSMGNQKVSLATGPRFNIASPSPSWSDFGWRAVIIFLFPKKA